MAAATPEAGDGSRRVAEEHWAVLGAGMLGLTLALRLASSGRRVTVLEAAPSPGGLTSGWRHGDVTWDRYYHVIESSDAHLLDLIGELGLDTELRWGVTRTNFWDGHRLYPLNDVFDYLRLPVMRLSDKLRLATNILYGAAVRDGGRLEGERAEDWLVRWSGRRAFETVWRPLLRSKLGANVEHASASYICSVIQRFYGARQGRRRTELFGYVQGGYGRIIETLLARLAELGVTVETGAPVRAVGPCAPGAPGAPGTTGVRVALASGERTFDRAVVTFASPFVSRVCDALSPREASQHDGLRYQGVVCASMLLRRPLGDAYLTYLTDESLPFTTVIEMSSLVDRAELGGRHLVYLPRYVPSEDAFLDADDATVEATFLPGLRRMFPDLEPDEIETTKIARARYVLAIPTLNYSAGLPPMRTTVPGLYVCNSAQIRNASLSVNETVDLANRAVADFLGN